MSCLSSSICFHVFPDFFMISETFKRVKSVGKISVNLSHLTGIETVASEVGLTENTDASVFPLEFWLWSKNTLPALPFTLHSMVTFLGILATRRLPIFLANSRVFSWLTGSELFPSFEIGIKI